MRNESQNAWRRTTRRPFSLSLRTLVLLAAMLGARAQVAATERVAFTVTPAASGQQLVRTSLPLPLGFLATNQTAVVRAPGHRAEPVGLRVLSWHPASNAQPRTARRALVTFSHRFADTKPVTITLTTAPGKKEKQANFPVSVHAEDESFNLAWEDGRRASLRLIAPARTSSEPLRLETVEENRGFRWLRFHFADPQWPRVIECRLDAAGGVVLVAHLQRAASDGNFAPELGWELATAAKRVRLQAGDTIHETTDKPVSHSFVEGREAGCLLDDQLAVYHPTAPLKRRGGIEIFPSGEGCWTYRYLRCRAKDRVPMQSMSWQRAEIVLAPPALAKLTSALTSPHGVEVASKLWSALYGRLDPLPSLPPTLDALVRHHREAIVRSAAVGDDFGNVTAYTDGAAHGGTFGMNRLNHGAAIFEDGWRSGDRRLTETALLWCDNVYDQTIWWGVPERGGTRYNNIVAIDRTPPTGDYM